MVIIILKWSVMKIPTKKVFALIIGMLLAFLAPFISTMSYSCQLMRSDWEPAPVIIPIIPATAAQEQDGLLNNQGQTSITKNRKGKSFKIFLQPYMDILLENLGHAISKFKKM